MWRGVGRVSCKDDNVVDPSARVSFPVEWGSGRPRRWFPRSLYLRCLTGACLSSSLLSEQAFPLHHAAKPKRLDTCLQSQLVIVLIRSPGRYHRGGPASFPGNQQEDRKSVPPGTGNLPLSPHEGCRHILLPLPPAICTAGRGMSLQDLASDT